MIDHIQKIAKDAAVQFAKSETGRRIVSHPQVQAAVLTAINRRAKFRRAMTERVQNLAKEHKLVTREDVAKLKKQIRQLESTVRTLRSELETKGAD